MHYTEVEMANSVSTPTKISARNPVCRLCGGSHEGRYMPRIFIMRRNYLLMIFGKFMLVRNAARFGLHE